jgi:uncharacterized membrane protein YccC
MSSVSRFVHHSSAELPQEMRELQRRISLLSPGDRRLLTEAFDRTAAMLDRRGRLLEMMQQAMSDLRHSLHCMAFDLEATRRERDLLKAQLEDSGDPENPEQFWG